MVAPAVAPAPVEKFIVRWQAAGGSERANYQLFLTELSELLELPKPEPAGEDTRDNAYVFERCVTFLHGDGTESKGFIDLYRRGAFVCEAKKVKQASATKGFDEALLRARSQAEQYARALPATEGRPPFLIVVDVGNVIELYAEFTRSGATYVPFPDPRSHRIKLADLRDEALRDRLRKVWLDPLALDPTRQSARVTREIAAQIATIAKSLEAAGYHPEQVAGFLSRCLFTFFAEDIGLLPKRAFADLLESLADKPRQFMPLLADLWKAMDAGEFSAAIREKVLHFNGKLFKQPEVLPLDRDQIGLLITAAQADWRQVEPAIFGTLLERALDPDERHALGAHYTPRAYVERLVLPTIIEPLREDWRLAQAAALTHASEGDLPAARTIVRDFHKKLCAIRVLDPACGSGNFLYVTLEHLKRLEGEVLNQLEELGDKQGLLELAGVTVDPHQFLGLELNPRAAAVAEMVLWIGYLQWHFRTRGQVDPPLPVLRDFHNIECRDALIAFDREEFLLDDQGKPVAHWDGKTMKVHPVTGKEVPDESQRTPVKKYINPRKAVWPEADFVIGNPPFIGAGPMRAALGDGYVEAIRGVWSEIPESADFVMFWWHHAAELTRAGKLQRFGFITTNSLRQTFNRRVVEAQLSAQNDRPSPAPALRAGATSPRKRGEVMSTLTSPRLRGEVAPTGAGEGQLIPQPLSLVFAIPDHPWVDAADGAAVRIAMTVASAGRHPGQLNEVVEERETGDDAMEVTLLTHRGIIHPDLRVGANVSSALPLRSNVGIAIKGFELGSQGFLIEKEQGDKWLKEAPELNRVVLPYMNGSDLILGRWDRYVIDFHGLTETEARKYGLAYQWVSDRVIPERKVNAEARTSKNWWLFRRSGEALRSTLSGLTKFIATTRTAKHRVFQFLPHNVVAESKIVVIATDDAGTLGILSSTIHVIWATASGAHLGVGNDPNYNHTECFDHFPFPITTPEQTITIRKLAASLDAHRKKQQAAHPELTLTALYNVLEKLKSGEPLSAKEKITHEQGLATVLKQLHDELDLAVLAAYGWSDLAPLMQIVNGNDRSRPRDDARRQLDETLLDRLVALNAERAAEEQRGLIRWLRPDFQNPQGKTAKPEPKQQEMELGADEDAATPAIAAERQPWPKELPAQVKAVAALLTASANPLTEPAIAARFTGRGPWKKRLPMILDMLVTLGRVRQTPQGYRAI